MPRGDKSAYTDKQKRQARHIEQGYRREGASEKRAERIAWATVNKQDGGGLKRRSSSRSRPRSTAASQSGSRSRTQARSRSRSGARGR